MLLKILVICAALYGAHCRKEHPDWDIAVVIRDQIELLQANGTLIGATVEQFTRLKALTFDNVRHQFVVSNNNQSNDTIFTVALTKETEITPIIPNLPDVLGLAVDPIEDVLYWTDSANKVINYAKLNSSTIVLEPKMLFDFSDETPQDIAIDVCRRQIYWTNANPNHPTIERAFLNGTGREVLIESGLNLPIGIAIDYKAQRLIWADRGEGIYYRIDSSDLDGNHRQLIYNGTDIKPFGIAVDDLSVYWTDVVNNALWRFYKSDKEGQNAKPESIRQFREQPMGIIAKNAQIRNYPDCKELEVAIESYRGESKEIFDTADPEEAEELIRCLNGGQLNGKYCKCTPGFVGRYCEQDKCHNFCVHGTCYLSHSGHPQCSCPSGVGGQRCQLDMCSTYCLNDGICSYYRGDLMPTCQCTNHFTGSRCEISTDFHSLCGLYCRESTSMNDLLVSKDRELVCRCENGQFVISKNNFTVPALYSESESAPVYSMSFFEKFTTDSDYTTLVLVCCLCVVLIVVLLVYLFASRNKRPIIKRRVIVNKNVTPLTYRSQPTTEQCEITMIENCCNMNVCETPCYEPSAFRKTKEDKKVLLADMENGEESY